MADVLRARLLGVELLTPEERMGDPSELVSHVLHTEEAFSVKAVVWQPGQITAIHDHVAWCAFGVLQGVEYETLYRDHSDHLTEIGRVANGVGDVSGFAPPGDIHRVHSTGDIAAISLPSTVPISAPPGRASAGSTTCRSADRPPGGGGNLHRIFTSRPRFPTSCAPTLRA